jgi:thiamine kinase-like enzyme
MDGTLYGYLKKDDLDFKIKFKTLLKELYEITLLLEELQDKFKFVHNDLKCDNIFYKNDKFYLGDFDNSSLEIKHYKINWQEFNQKKDLFILTQSLFFSFNDDNWRKYFFKYFPIIDNIKNQKEFHQLYNYKNINDIYIPSNYKKIIENILSN